MLTFDEHGNAAGQQTYRLSAVHGSPQPNLMHSDVQAHQRVNATVKPVIQFQLQIVAKQVSLRKQEQLRMAPAFNRRDTNACEALATTLVFSVKQSLSSYTYYVFNSRDGIVCFRLCQRYAVWHTDKKKV